MEWYKFVLRTRLPTPDCGLTYIYCRDVETSFGSSSDTYTIDDGVLHRYSTARDKQGILYPVYTIKQTSSKRPANIKQI